MISTSSAFSTANAKLQKQPTYILEIEGYVRAFTNRTGLGSFAGLPSNPVIQFADRITDFGGFTPFPGDVTLPNATPAGNILFAFLYHGDGGTSVSISDAAANTWTLLFSTSSVSIWWATAVSAAAGNVITFVTGATRGNSEFYVCEVSSSYSGFSFGHASGSPGGTVATVTVGPNTFSVPGIDPLSSWQLYGVALAPAVSPSMGINLGFLVASYSIPSGQFIAGGAAAELVIGGRTTAYDWLVSIDDLKQTISDLDGSSNLADLVFNVQDFAQQITADMASFVFEGKKCRLLSGFVGMTVDQFVTLFSGVVDKVESDNLNLEYKFTVPSLNSKKLSQTIYTTGDDGFPTDSKHPKTLNGHPLDMFVSALQQCGVAISDIDTAKIFYYRDGIFNGLSYEFSLTSAPTAKEFIENELMKPLGMYWREDNLAAITVSAFYPALFATGSYTPPTYPQATLDTSVIADVPVEQQADLVDQVTFRFDENGSSLDAEIVQTWAAAVTKYGLYGGQIIESKGMRSAFQGYFMAAFIARLIFLRYGNKPIVLDPVPLLWSECILEPGDIIAVTLPYIPDRHAGVLGVTVKAFEVLDRNWRLMDGICEPKLLEIDLSKFKDYLITPNAQPDFAADTALNQAKYMYQCDAAGKYSTGAPGNTLG
jgi:hypothetical protein